LIYFFYNDLKNNKLHSFNLHSVNKRANLSHFKHFKKAVQLINNSKIVYHFSTSELGVGLCLRAHEIHRWQTINILFPIKKKKKKCL
jgi:hypothetical protein